MNPTLLPAALTAAALLLIHGVSAREPYTPAAGNLVLVRLPTGTSRLATGPSNLAEALPRARDLIHRARLDGDPRALGQAQAVLGPWWLAGDAPPEVVLLRAEIRQGLHDFTGALTDLDLALRRDSRHAGAWLTRATIQQLLGQYADARRSCVQVLRCGDGFAATTASAALAGLIGADGTDAIRQLAGLLAHTETETPERQAWA